MQIRIHDPAQIGEIVRATRKAEHMRQDVIASAIGVSENFLGKVERGNSSVYWHKLFHVLSELGIHVYLDVPSTTEAMLDRAARGRNRTESRS
jgi:predicted transcriptional regulator